MELLFKISITCFFASYLVSFVLEITRLFFRARLQMAITIGFALAGLFAHTVFLMLRIFADTGTPTPLGSWQIWCLTVAWVLAGIYLYFAWRQPKADTGLFLLPMVLILCAAGYWLSGKSGFSVDGSSRFLASIHGISLLLGTVAVFAGFVCGLMYLIHSAQLKAKVSPTRRFKLPSLEWLQAANERSLVISSVLLAAGLVSGLLLNLRNSESAVVQWSSPVVWTSAVFFGWVVTATIFNWLYKPARHGRKVAYLLVVSFLFLVIELVIVLSVQHASDREQQPAAPFVIEQREFLR